MLPTTQEYKISLMIGQDSFRTLEGVEVIPNPHYPDEPWYSTGGLAIVFKLKFKDKLYALKCFYTEANERQERLGLIAAYLKQNPSPYFVDFTYLENELWVETANDEGQGYPVVLMEWVEGKTLDNYLEQICTQNNTPALQNLYFQFCNLAWWLQQQPIAHGDIKHDNLIVTPDGKLKLIDYDGVFVPALRGRKANEMGSPCYQHPKRDAYFFDKNLDDFSLLILQITLLALQQQPKLFTEHYNGDGIMLQDTDYLNFAQSPIKTILWQLPEIKIPLLLSQLQGNLNNLNAIDLMPLLQDVAWINWLVGGQKDGKLEFERQKLKEDILKFWKPLFINSISLNYSLNRRSVEKYQDKWDWKGLSDNNALPWSIELIEKYEDKWDWYWLSRNKSLPWSEKLIENYFYKWDHSELSRNEALPLSIKFIQKHVENGSGWSWYYLSQNEGLSWSFELIEMFKNKWEWKELSRNSALPWSIELIEKYKYKWHWRYLCRNEGINWTIELIEIYEPQISSGGEWGWDGLSSNDTLPWSLELIIKYENKWSWGPNGYLVGFGGFSTNVSLPWSVEFIQKYIDKWNWFALSENPSLPWCLNLIEIFETHWKWMTLSRNETLSWSFELIEKFKYKWDWGELSDNNALPWSIELIEKYESEWHWEKLCLNKSLPWSIELTKKYKWGWHNLRRNNGIYEKVFQPLLNDEFIDEIMAEISGTS